MSLDQAVAPEGLGTSPATPTNANETTETSDNRYEGFSSPDDPESADLPATPESEGDEGVEDQEAQGEPDPWEGFEDYEHDGTVYKIPSALKENLLLKADHTRRLQEVAETKKQLQAREQELVQRSQISEQELEARSALLGINAQLKDFETFDWQGESAKAADDPMARLDLQDKWRRFQELRGYQQQFGTFLNNAAQQREAQVQQESQQRLAETRSFAEKNIKGWTPELDLKITEFAIKDLGFDVETLKGAYNPQVYKTLYFAYLGQQSQIRQQSAKPTPNAKPPVATQTVTTKANVMPSFDPEKSSMDDYAKNWAQRQARKSK